MHRMIVMKKLILLLFLICSLVVAGKVNAQIIQNPTGSLETGVSASVGEFYLNVSGFISPYASIILTSSDGTFIRAAVADANGNFFISQVLINKGFSGFCLEAVDFARVGDSTTCFSFPPATGSITMNNLFLPPTIALSRNEVAQGQTVTAFGYTMPGAIVTLRLSNGQILTTTADSKGYYSFKVPSLSAGTYEIYAKARYQDKESLTPTKKVELKSLSLWQQILAFLQDLFSKIIRFFTSISFGPLWIAIPILILIIILIIRLWPEKFTFLYRIVQGTVTDSFNQTPKLLHDWWWVGY